MKQFDLRSLIFLALLADIGMFSKQLILPVVNVFTGILSVPGGIATSFSLMFLVIGACSLPQRGCAALMGVIQSVLALCLGMTGSMGALAVIGYIIPGIVIDAVIAVKRNRWSPVIACIAASVSACLFRNLVVYHFGGIYLLEYVLTAALSGMVCGCFAKIISDRLLPFFQNRFRIRKTA